MVRVSPPQHGFSSGEISPQLWGRPDFPRYANGLEQARGFVVIAEGSALRLPGTRHVGRVKNDAPARLVPAVLFDRDSYMLEWTDRTLRIWRDGVLVESGGTPYELAVPYEEGDLPNLQWVPSGDRLRLVDGRLHPQQLTRRAHDDWSIRNTPFELGPFLAQNLDKSRTLRASATQGVVTLTANFDIFEPDHVGAFFRLDEVDRDDVPEWLGGGDLNISVGQRRRVGEIVYQVVAFGSGVSFDTGTAAPSHMDGTIKPAYSGGPQWADLGSGNLNDAPQWEPALPASVGDRYYVEAVDHTYELASYGHHGSGRVGSNAPTHREGRWLSQVNGPVWEVIHDGGGVVRVTSVTDARHATATVVSRLPDNVVEKSTYRWREGAWSESQGYPRAIIELDQRVIYGGVHSAPLTVYFSEIGRFDSFKVSTEADGAFFYQAPTPRRRQSRILWIEASGSYIFIGTAAGVIVGRASDDSQGFTIETTRFYPGPTGGVAEVQAEMIDGRPVYLSTDAKRLYALIYDLETDRNVADPQTLAARHVLSPGVAWMAWQELPWRVLWLGLTNGELVSLSVEPDPKQQVVGFARHSLGGIVESGAVKPTADMGSEELWLVVRRSIGGVEQRHVEVMADPFGLDNGPDDPPDLKDAWHLMSAIRWQGEPAATISGLDHLEGEIVWAWTDLGALGPFTVAGGEITLPEPVTSAIVGIDVADQQRLRTLDIQAGAADGGAEGRLKAMRGVGARLLHSAGGAVRTIQQDPDGTERASRDWPLLDPQDRRLLPLTLFSGPVDVDPKFGWSHGLKLEFSPGKGGAPLTIQAVTPTIMTTDG